MDDYRRADLGAADRAMLDFAVRLTETPSSITESDLETLRATVQGLPGPSDISLPVDANIVVEFLSR